MENEEITVPFLAMFISGVLLYVIGSLWERRVKQGTRIADGAQLLTPHSASPAARSISVRFPVGLRGLAPSMPIAVGSG